MRTRCCARGANGCAERVARSPEVIVRRRWLRIAAGVAFAACAATRVGAGPGTNPGAAPPRDAAVVPDAAGRFAFALIGDQPYTALDERQLDRVLAAIDDDVAFVMHVGDLKSSSEACTDALLERRAAQLGRARQPLVFVPGDNEWTDCGRARPAFDPYDRLERLRALFHGQPALPAALAREWTAQGAAPEAGVTEPWPEHLRWWTGRTLFTTLNLPGSDHGFDAPGIDPARERRRQQAVAAWLAAGARHARSGSAAAWVIAAHANPRFERGHRPAAEPGPGYDHFRRVLGAAAAEFAGPVLFVHGDTHRHRVDRPALDGHGRALASLLRVESFGYPFGTQWVRIDVDPGRPEVFGVQTRTLPEPPRLG